MSNSRALIHSVGAGSCAVVLVAAPGASSGVRQASNKAQAVDAAAFALAVHQGRAQEYKGRIVSGEGLDFHGSWPSLDLTVGSAAVDGQPKPLATWEEFLDAQRARTTLIVALNVAGFTRTSWPKRGTTPAAYGFSGVFNGTMKTIPRLGGPS